MNDTRKFALDGETQTVNISDSAGVSIIERGPRGGFYHTGLSWPAALKLARHILDYAPETDKVECGNCDWQGTEEQTNSATDIEERVSPGEIMPVGECPECGALCHYSTE